MRKELMVARSAAEKAGQIIIEHLQRGTVIRHKQSHNLVSDADLAAERAIVALIRESFPNHDFLGEEIHKDDVGGKAVWVIDPLDGTNNFAHGFPFFCTSIAFVEDGVTQVGAIYNPVAGELFCCERGGGAYCNDEPVRVSTATNLTEALISTGFYYDRGHLLSKTLEAIHALFHAGIHGIRRTGSAALDLCYLSAGRIDGFFEYKLMPWDFAAGALLLTEAGGAATDSYGKPLDVFSEDVVCSNGSFHAQLLQIVAEHRPDSATCNDEGLTV